jgi:ATP synthase I chain.
MAGEALRKTAGLPGAWRAALMNLSAGLLCTAVLALSAERYTGGFAAGYVLGFLNIVWLFNIVKRAMKRPPEKVISFVAARYYLRFFLTAGVIFFIIREKAVAEPWAIVAGITVSIFTAVGSLIYLAKEELR